MSDAEAIVQSLKDEGFGHAFVWRDGPGAAYPPHTHPGTTAHVVLEGLITITAEGRTDQYGPGERFDVPAGQIHSAEVGANGCVYVVGE